MTDREALMHALNFIERVNVDGWILADFEPQMYAAITALREALARTVMLDQTSHDTKRPWVWLTPEERQWLLNQPYGTTHGLAIAIEAKLKEKNL